MTPTRNTSTGACRAAVAAYLSVTVTNLTRGTCNSSAGTIRWRC